LSLPDQTVETESIWYLVLRNDPRCKWYCWNCWWTRPATTALVVGRKLSMLLGCFSRTCCLFQFYKQRLLSLGYTLEDIFKASISTRKGRQERMMSLQSKKWDSFSAIAELASRRLQKLVSKETPLTTWQKPVASRTAWKQPWSKQEP
jgi:hypothetical protein